ncbi:DUF5320 domain-containing protein [bacterium]|nr:DUF5320 domain-containing protein [bacterium]
MPRGDGTGPAGMGPMTGRAAGYCAGYPVPGFMNPYGGRFGGGFGRGRGFGWRRWGYLPPAPYGIAPYGAVPYGPSYTPEEETELLRNQAKSLEDQLEQIQKRLTELETEAKKGSK